jgi:D-xylose transport system permease protein
MHHKLTLRDFALVITLLLICGFFGVMSPDFFSARNLSFLITEVAITATLAIGMLLVILPGHIDLSAGSGVGLIGGIAAVLITHHHWPAALAMAAGLASALGLWFAMGALIVRQRVPAFIITLGGLLVFKGLFWLVINYHTVPVVIGGQSNLLSVLTTYYLPGRAGYIVAAGVVAVLVIAKVRGNKARSAYGLPSDDGELAFLKLFLAAQLIFLFVIVTNQFRGVPLPALILATVASLVWLLTHHTPFGRYLYAIGGNEEAAIISGIPVQSVTITAYVLMGSIVAMTGFMQTAYGGNSTTTVGDLMELDAVAACVIGGVSLKGGRGTVLGVLFGALIMACLINGMTLIAVETAKKFIARGLVLIMAVLMDVHLSKKSHP